MCDPHGILDPVLRILPEKDSGLFKQVQRRVMRMIGGMEPLFFGDWLRELGLKKRRFWTLSNSLPVPKGGLLEGSRGIFFRSCKV